MGVKCKQSCIESDLKFKLFFKRFKFNNDFVKENSAFKLPMN